MSRWWVQLGRYGARYRRGLSVITLLTFLGVGLQLLKPWPLKVIVDNVLDQQPLPRGVGWVSRLPGGDSPGVLLGWLAGATVVLFLAARAIGITNRYVRAGAGSRMVFDLGGALFSHLQRLSLSYHHRHRTGDLVRRVTTDTTCVRELVIGTFLPLLSSLVTLVAMFAVMWQMNRALSVLAILVVVPMGAAIRFLSAPMTERTYEQNQLEGERMAMAEQTLTALPIIQAFNREEGEQERFRSLSRRTLRAHLRLLAAQIRFDVSIKSVTAVGTAAVMISGGIAVLQETLTLGGLLVFLSYLTSLYAPLESLASLSCGFASAAGGARRVLEVMEAGEAVRDAPDAQALPPRPAGQVLLEGVTFGYEPGRPVLNGVTLEAGPGETVALVGSTGAGKSTLVSLIPRLFDPWEGRVEVDGVDVRRLSLASLRAQVAIVLQEPFLLPLTVARNIAYGRPGASRDEVISAATAANADAFIRRLPRGYDTVIGERGATLSGGQRQRLAIARAVLKDAAIVILDEPTSALDPETEQQVMDALERLTKGRTTIVIAHRFSTIRRADRIAVLAGGEIVEQGTRESLLAAGGTYQRMHELQIGSLSAAVGI